MIKILIITVVHISLFLVSITGIMSQETDIYSDFLKQNRSINIHLPDNYNYSDNKLKYPVIYIFDGELLFEYLVGLYKYNFDIYPPAIIIGVNQLDRNIELGTSEVFTSYFIEELIPFIDTTYRTNTIKIVIGHSFGGAFVLNSCLQTTLIKTVLAISPVIKKEKAPFIKDFKPFDLIDRFKNQQNETFPKDIYFGYGENDFKYLMSDTDTLYNFINKNYKGLISTHLDIYPREDHNSAILIGIRRGLMYAFRNFILPESDWDLIEETDNDSIFYQYFEKISIYYDEEIIPTEEDYNSLGYYYLNHNKIDKAIVIFTKNTTLYPFSSNTYDSLGEAFEKKEEIKNAIKCYKKAIEIEKKGDNDVYALKVYTAHYNNLKE